MTRLFSPKGLLFLSLYLVIEPGNCRRELNEYIKHFEPVDYDHNSLMWHHNRVRRSMMGPEELELHFEAFGRSFDISLQPEKKLFHPNFTLTMDGVAVPKQQAKTHLYSGSEWSDAKSRVYGNLAHGVFDGTIETNGEVYHLEPAIRYSEHLNSNDTFHSLIYRQSDIDHTSISTASCGSSQNDIKLGMLHLQNSIKREQHDHILKKRQARNSNLVRCWLNVILDYKLYTYLQGNNEIPKAVLLSIILRGSSIFEDTDFDGDGNPDRIHFGILDMEIETTPPPAGNFFANDFIGVESFLNQHSTADYSDYCLSYRFTHRDFDDGVVGLAYVAPQPDVNSAGGICQNLATFAGGEMKTLNTGIVTSLNYGRRIPPSISALTFAHEAGHNFGSQHDSTDPPPDGAYIMHAFATDGSQPNNDMFSQESIGYMNPVIADRGQGQDGCFVEAGDLCGNNLIDEGEECDCGPSRNLNPDGTCIDNLCCNGANCTLSINVDCSPDQGPCCNSSCMFVPSSDNLECSTNTDCALNQTCGGSSAFCPLPEGRMVPDDPGYILCDMEEGICDGPTCNGTICLVIGLENCECGDMNQSCHVCCVYNGVCTSSIVLAQQNETIRNRLPGMMGRNVTVGSPCANFTGYCDFLSNCRSADENGALVRLGNLFFNSEAFRRAIDFVTRMWWVVLIVAVVILVIMFAVVILFHCILPRPEHAKNRDERRRTKRRNRQVAAGGGDGANYNQFEQGNYPQNYPQYYK